MSKQTTPKEFNQKVDTVFKALAAAAELEQRIQNRLEELEALGMYPAIPSEQWQERKNGASKYLYMIFKKNSRSRRFRYGATPNEDIPEYQGPKGRRKIYVGADPERIQAAREMVVRKREHSRLSDKLRTLDYWVDGLNRQINDAAGKAESALAGFLAEEL